MEKKTTIGNLIHEEVLKQKKTIQSFADEICCTRKNAYDIFERNNIDIQLLLRISKVLNHNYFDDLAKDPDLARPIDADYERQRAVGQFNEVMPFVFERLGLSVCITTGTREGIEKDIPLPDFVLSDFNITFTIGQTFKDKCGNIHGDRVLFEEITADNGARMVFCTNQVTGFQSLDIAIDYKTMEEWEETMIFALEQIPNYYLPRTLYDIEHQREIQQMIKKL